MSTSSLDIVVGGSWKVDARYLARLYSYRGDGEPFDYTPILDIIDIVVDGANITSRLPEESIFCVMHELVAGLSRMGERQLDKHIVTFPEAGWELAIQHTDGEFEISFYGAERPRHVSVHNVRVRGDRLLDAVYLATERLLNDLVSLNDAFARESTVRWLAEQLSQLRSLRFRETTSDQHAEAPHSPNCVAVNVGDRRLGMALEFDATHPDFWRYQGALTSDLHSLLFQGTVHLTYWGKRRVLGEGTYLFPLVEGLVAGAERLLQLVERRAGGCVILDGSDGSQSVLTAEMLDADHLVLRVTEPNRSVGQTRTTPKQVFTVILDTVQRLLLSIVDLNPRQTLNHRVHDLRGGVEHLRGQIFDILRGDVYFENVQGYLKSVPDIEPHEDDDGLRHGQMSYPIDKLRHVFLRSTWYLARNHIHFRELVTRHDKLLVPSDGRLECVNRDLGRPVWSSAADGLLGVSSEVALVGTEDGIRGIDLEDGSTQCAVDLGGCPSSALLFQLNGRSATILQLAEAEIAAVDLSAGRPLWRFALEHGELVGLTLAGPVVALVSDDGFAYGLRPENGSLLWKVRVPGICVIPPAFHEGRLYLCADADVGLEGVLYSIYPLTGRRVYERRVPGSFSRLPMFVGGVGVFALETPAHATILALDLEDGRRLWLHPVKNAHVDTPVLCWVEREQKGILLIKTDTGQCYGVELRTGETQWSTQLLDPGDILLANLEPTLLDNHLVVAERFTSILNPSTGRRLHRFTDLPEHPCFLHVDDNLRLIIGEGDDHLECFDLSGFLALVDD